MIQRNPLYLGRVQSNHHKAMFYSPAIDMTCFNVRVCLFRAFGLCVCFTLSLEDYWTDCMSQYREDNVPVFLLNLSECHRDGFFQAAPQLLE